MSDGWDTDYYELPEGAREMQDLIEHRGMNFAVGNIFKAVYRMGEKNNTSREYDLNKIIWYANRELNRIRKCPPANLHQNTTLNTTEPPRPSESGRCGIRRVTTQKEKDEFIRAMERK
jgi:hypothetical protein